MFPFTQIGFLNKCFYLKKHTQFLLYFNRLPKVKFTHCRITQVKITWGQITQGKISLTSNNYDNIKQKNTSGLMKLVREEKSKNAPKALSKKTRNGSE